MGIEEILQRDSKFRYMLLGRMQSDCEYYLGFGNRNQSRLWAGNEEKQIEYMKRIHESFSDGDKPQWLSMSQILDYARQMIRLQNKILYLIPQMLILCQCLRLTFHYPFILAYPFYISTPRCSCCFNIHCSHRE